MSSDCPDNVYHHVDYKYKADLRKKELEELRKRSLAKVEAAKLADAEAPMQQHNFLEKQRELFQEQRKHQAAAMEFLHQYRADDEIILKNTTRRDSRGLSIDSKSVTPDAKAAQYYYEAHSNDVPFAVVGSPSKSPDNHLCNVVSFSARLHDPPDTVSPDYESTRAHLQEMAALAAKIPLPKSFDGQDGDDDDADHLLICQGASIDEADILFPSPSSNTNNIPFESFLRLGASQMGDTSPAIIHHQKNGSLADSSDGDDSIIPMASFMKLGASMLAEAITASKSCDDGQCNNHETIDGVGEQKIRDDYQNDNETDREEDDTAPLTEAGQSQLLDDSALQPITAWKEAVFPQTGDDNCPLKSPFLKAELRDERVADCDMPSFATSLVEVKTAEKERENSKELQITTFLPQRDVITNKIVLNPPGTDVQITWNDVDREALSTLVAHLPNPRPISPSDQSVIENADLLQHDEEIISARKISNDVGLSKAYDTDLPTNASQGTDLNKADFNVIALADKETRMSCEVGLDLLLTDSTELTRRNNDVNSGEEPIPTSNEARSMEKCYDDGPDNQRIFDGGAQEGTVVTPTQQRSSSTQRRRKKKADGYHPSSSRFVYRHFFSR
ncbi:hypothetical protein IV203_010456 [Nitzschia inconspicua]|uniref:Uncharacterized protein n=1 Tax=Nitzschia inconspicua TaxID=303405 RepID=A0A9K3KWX7_9STRA|nr:hypothetical protein IV203_010456 [Nitzschia inconspicua]